MKLFFISTLIVCIQNSSASCPLKWVDASLGKYPSDAVSSDSQPTQYVARVTIYDNGTRLYVSGRLEPSTGAYIVYEGEQLYKSYQVLTNPFRCKLDWLYACCGQYPANSVGGKGFESNGLVGREHRDSKHLPGKVIPSSGLIWIMWENKKYSSPEYEVLTSTGLRVSVARVKYELPAVTVYDRNVELIGQTILINNSSATLRQTVSHQNWVQQSYSFTFAKSWAHTFAIDLEASFPVNVIGVSIKESYYQTRDTIKSFTGTVESNAQISREIELPAFTTVKITDSIAMVDKHPIKFEAVGKFYGDSLTGEQVQDLLGSDFDGEIIRVADEAVYAKIKGTFNGRWGYRVEGKVTNIRAY